MSDILIKNMKMPTKGYRLILVHADGTVQTTDGETTAIPMPEHGRLIDADALLKKCEFVCTDDDEDIRAVRYSIIENAPTIIPASEGGIK